MIGFNKLVLRDLFGYLIDGDLQFLVFIKAGISIGFHLVLILIIDHVADKFYGGVALIAVLLLFCADNDLAQFLVPLGQLNDDRLCRNGVEVNAIGIIAYDGDEQVGLLLICRDAEPAFRIGARATRLAFYG